MMLPTGLCMVLLIMRAAQVIRKVDAIAFQADRLGHKNKIRIYLQARLLIVVLLRAAATARAVRGSSS